MVIAVVVALIQYSKVPVLRHICRFYVWVIRGTPLLVQLYVVFFGLPSIGIMVDAFLAAVIVFSINEGAYNAETIGASGIDGSWTLRRPELFSNHVARSFASGFQNGFSCAGQLDDFNGQRYFFGGEHHGG